jgi:[NiFe] hydrogenase assembly HybE family chaperone
MQVENPAVAVEAVFRRIEKERMAGMPMLNTALAVEAVDFALHEGRWLGVLVTPWSMSLMLLPTTRENWIGAPEGKHLHVQFPAGELAFLGGAEPEIGEYLSCSLFTSMAEFADQESARLTARASRLALLAPPPAVEAPASPGRRGFLTGRIDSGKRHA